MQVIKHGNTYKEIVCVKCGALLSYCEKDVKTKFNGGEYCGKFHSVVRKWIECPECCGENDILLIVDGDKVK